jgi:hypothetical protein
MPERRFLRRAPAKATGQTIGDSLNRRWSIATRCLAAYFFDGVAVRALVIPTDRLWPGGSRFQLVGQGQNPLDGLPVRNFARQPPILHGFLFELSSLLLHEASPYFLRR